MTTALFLLGVLATVILSMFFVAGWFCALAEPPDDPQP